MSILAEKIKFELKRHKSRYVLFMTLAMYYVTAQMVMIAIGMSDFQMNVTIWFVIIPASMLFCIALYNIEKRYKLQGEIVE